MCVDMNISEQIWMDLIDCSEFSAPRTIGVLSRRTDLTAFSVSALHRDRDRRSQVSNSTDLSILVWRTGTGERLHCLAAVRDMPRAGPWRNIIGWPVAGVSGSDCGRGGGVGSPERVMRVSVGTQEAES